MFSLTHCLLALGLVARLVNSQSSPIPPTQDPWYSAPPGFEATLPGTVLRIRAAPGNLTSVYGNSSSAWNILYRTTDNNHKASWAVTTILAPKKQQKPADQAALVSYMIPYNTPDVDASPSYALYGPSYSTEIYGSDISALLSHGWLVNVPDFEGPHASFGCLVQAGFATLDAIRAALSLHQHSQYQALEWAPHQDSTRLALWGFSGGSLASEFAAELQTQYAPELSSKFAGAALAGLVTNFTTTLGLASGELFAGLVPSALVGLSTQNSQLNETLLDSLKTSGPSNASTFLSVEHLDFDDIIEAFAYQDIGNYFDSDNLDIQYTPAYVQAVTHGSITGQHGVPRMPLYVFKGIYDQIAPIAETDALVAKYCAAGANIQYVKNSIGGHLATQVNSDAPILGWLHAVLGGSNNHTGCSVQNVAVNVTDSPN